MKDREYKRLLRKSLEDNLQYNKKYEEVLGYCGLSSDDPLTKKLINKKKYKFRKLIVTLACLCTLLAVSTCVFMIGFYEIKNINEEAKICDHVDLTDDEIKYIESYGCDISTLSKIDYDMNKHYQFIIFSFVNNDKRYYFLKLNKIEDPYFTFLINDVEYFSGFNCLFMSNKKDYGKNKLMITTIINGKTIENIVYV